MMLNDDATTNQEQHKNAETFETHQVKVRTNEDTSAYNTSSSSTGYRVYRE